MKKAVAMTALGLSLISSVAIAEERATDAALGAVSGAVVLGPIGAVAGALVGYTAGPSISQSWRSRRSHGAHQHARLRPREARAPVGADQPAAANQASPPSAASAQQAPAAAAAMGHSNAPPVQTLE